jgi:hypothetical protein
MRSLDGGYGGRDRIYRMRCTTRQWTDVRLRRM